MEEEMTIRLYAKRWRRRLQRLGKLASESRSRMVFVRRLERKLNHLSKAA